MDEARALVRALYNSSVSPIPWPLLHASMLKNYLFLISLHLLCTGMDETRALVRALCSCSGVSCVVASTACMTAKKCSVLFLISLHLLCTDMDEARALVRSLCNNSVSPVSSPLLHAWLLINDLFLISLHLLCMGMDEARALVHALCTSNVSLVSSPLLHA